VAPRPWEMSLTYIGASKIAASQHGLTNYHLWPPFLSRPAAAPTGQLLNPSQTLESIESLPLLQRWPPRSAIIFCLFCLLTRAAILT